MKKIVLIIGFLLLCLTVSVSAELTDTEKIEQLEQKVAALEGNQSDHEARLTALETWKTTIELAINNIVTQLESVKQWLLFWDHQGAEDNVCTAIENECFAEPPLPPDIECSSDDDCDADAWAGDQYCSDDDLYQNARDWFCVNPDTEESYCSYIDTPTVVEDCDYGCDSAACNPEPTAGKVIFRTNVVQGDGNNYNLGITTDDNGAWIALDADGDESLEAYGKTNGAMYGCDVPEAEVGVTSDGFKLVKDDLGDIGVCYRETGSARRYSASDSDADNAELSELPTDPYTSNGQELYEGGTGPGGGGGGGGGGGDGGSGINVSINVTPGTS